MNKIKFKSIIFDSGLGVKFLISMIPRICQEKVRMLSGGKFTFESWKISFHAGKFHFIPGNFIPDKKISFQHWIFRHGSGKKLISPSALKFQTLLEDDQSISKFLKDPGTP